MMLKSYAMPSLPYVLRRPAARGADRKRRVPLQWLPSEEAKWRGWEQVRLDIAIGFRVCSTFRRQALDGTGILQLVDIHDFDIDALRHRAVIDFCNAAQNRDEDGVLRCEFPGSARYGFRHRL